MTRSQRAICLLAVISLFLEAIWPVPAKAVEIPAFEPLGQIREGLNMPTRLAVDELGSLYVADSLAGRVVKFDKYGKLVASIEGLAVYGGGLAVTADGSRLYVADRTSVAIVDVVTGWQIGHLGGQANEFGYVIDIALDASGRIFVADADQLKIKVYDASGTFSYAFGAPGSSSGQFNSIAAMAVDRARNELYVADPTTVGSLATPEIQVFDLSGNLVRTLIGKSSFNPKKIAYFSGMTFDDSGRWYVFDSLGGYLVAMGHPATYLTSYGQSGFGEGQFQAPRDSVFDPATGRLFVLNEDARIEIFGLDGAQNPVDLNTKPTLPSPISPLGSSEVAGATPQVSFTNAVDADGDTLTYQVRILRSGQLLAEYLDIPAGASETTALIQTQLTENDLYQWQVQASDGEDVSGWTAESSFYLNALEEAPTAPVAISPLASEKLGGSGELSWQASDDPDPGDTVLYQLEIAAESTFSELVASQSYEATTCSLAELEDYAALSDETTYFWRVQAVDNHGVESGFSDIGQFTFDTTILRVTANMPGARVYIDGNPGFSGRFLGEAPLEVRDFEVAPRTLVIERAGFEPFFAAINPLEGDTLEVYAELVPSLAPVFSKVQKLEAVSGPAQFASAVAPFLVDFDNDGAIDLLASEASGALTLYRGLTASEGNEELNVFSQTPIALAISLPPGSAPIFADWNNDGRKDLVVGAADGTVSVYLNAGTEMAPAFASGTYLVEGNEPIQVSGDAVPAVIDYDNDTDKDLVVGSSDGTVWLYLNQGSDDQPLLAPAGALASISDAVAPVYADWDADGTKDLLLATDGAIFTTTWQQESGGFILGDAITHKASKNKKAKKLAKKSVEAGLMTLGNGLRIAIHDIDGRFGKDLVVGNAAGEVLVIKARGRSYQPTFTQALMDKVAQIEGLIGSEDNFRAESLAALNLAIEEGDLEQARKVLRTCQAQAVKGGPAAKGLEELNLLLH